MDKKEMATYANAFTFTLNKRTNEALLVFTQGQPGYSASNHAFEMADDVVVSNLVLPYGLLLELSTKVLDAAKAEEADNNA